MGEERDMERRKAAVSREEVARRRSNARRTALVLALIVLAIFIAFLITGVTGRGA